MSDAPTRSRRALLVALVLLGLMYGLTRLRTAPPRPLPVDAPPEKFSGVRAFAQLKRLIEGEVPHPVGSAQDEQIRQQIVAELQRLQLRPRVQDAFVCNPAGNCATVRNVVVKIEGRESGKAVLGVAHYDSVAAGPGASDDGSGVVSLLEVARALQAGKRPRHAVILLLDEGEEPGLFGAQAFAEQDPWRDEVGAVVNLEARGTSGPSIMFETSGPNAWLVQAMAEALPHPVSTSLFPMVYELLPNDTDLTVFKRKGIPGVNFAFIGGASHYHTPLDDSVHLDPCSLQHQGENALGMIRALAEADLNAPPSERVVFFDLLGSGLVSWPLRWTRPLAFIALGLVLSCLVILKRRRAIRGWQVAGAALGFCAAVVLAGALGYGFTRLLMARPDFSTPWIETPGPAIGASWGLGFAAIALLCGHLLRRVDGNAVWIGVWTCWAIFGIAVSGRLAGASYLFIAPSLVAGGLGLLWLPTLGPPSRGGPTVLPALAVAAIWFPLAQAWYDALGLPLLAGLSICGAFVLSSVAPLIVALDRRAQWEGVGVAALASMLLAGTALSLPQHSSVVPVPVSLVLHEDGDTGAAKWLAEAPGSQLPASLQQSFPFSGPTLVSPWQKRPSWGRAAASPGLRVPVARLQDDATAGSFRRLRLHLSSARGASVVGLAFGPDAQVEALSMGRAPVELAANSASAWQLHSVWATPDDGVDVIVTTKAGTHPELVVMDTTFGLPAEGTPLMEARTPSAVPGQWGDRVVVTRTFRW